MKMKLEESKSDEKSTNITPVQPLTQDDPVSISPSEDISTGKDASVGDQKSKGTEEYFSVVHRILLSPLFLGLQQQRFGILIIQSIFEAIDKFSFSSNEYKLSERFKAKVHASVNYVIESFNRTPSVVLRDLAMTPDGSRLLQKFITLLRKYDHTKDCSNKTKKGVEMQSVVVFRKRQRVENPLFPHLVRFLRRFRPVLLDLAQNTYGSWLLETILEQAGDTREVFLQDLLKNKGLMSLRRSKVGRHILCRYELETRARDRILTLNQELKTKRPFFSRRKKKR